MLHPTNENALLQEIEEDLARQKYEELWRRFGPTILTVAALIIIVTASLSGWKSYRLHTEQKDTAAIMELLETKFEKDEDRVAAFDAFAAAHKGTAPAVLAQLHEAALLLEKGKKEDALAVYDAMAADSSIERFFRDFAALLAVQTEMDTGDAAALATRLEPLMAEDCAWRFSATEYAAHLALRQGDKAKAKELFQKLAEMPGTPEAMLNRSAAMLGWLGGEE